MKMPKEKNQVMQALNSLKQAVSQAVSQIEKEFTMQETNMEGEEQDGNMGEAVNGEQDYSATEYNAKKKMLISKLMGSK